VERRAIEAVYVEAVYNARRQADLQLAGELPVPVPSRRALELLERADGLGGHAGLRVALGRLHSLNVEAEALRTP